MKQMKKLQLAIQRARHRRSLPSPEMCQILRLRAGITQADIAWSIGTTAAAISRYESGKRKPRGHHLDKYLEAIEALTHANPTA